MRRVLGVLVVAMACAALLAGCGRFGGRAETKESTSVVEPTQTVTGKEPTASKTPTAPPSNETTLVTNGKSDVAGIVRGSATLSTFQKLYEASGMMPVLAGKNPITVIAPNDDAFSDLGTKTVDALLQPGNKPKLQDLLRYHLMTGTVPTSQLITIRTAMTYLGPRLRITSAGSTCVLNEKVVVIAPDVKAKNGLVDVVNVVLIPPGWKL